MISFYNDYSEGAHEQIIEALTRTNRVQSPGYGEDEFCEEAKSLIRRHLKKPETAIHFLVGGTQTNTTVIASVLKPYQGALLRLMTMSVEDVRVWTSPSVVMTVIFRGL